MPSYMFHSDRPDLFGADVDHGELGRRYEQLLRHPAYTDPNHPEHMAVKGDVMALAEAIWGDKPIDAGQPFAVRTISSATGEFITPTVATGQGTPDEHVVPGHRSNEGG